MPSQIDEIEVVKQNETYSNDLNAKDISAAENINTDLNNVKNHLSSESNSDDFYRDTVCHRYYSFSYSEDNEQPVWVNYILTKEMMQNPMVKRKDEFREDPDVQSGSAQLKDYVGSGYDRGHLCPAKAMECSKIAMSESFFMSNMSPQHPSLNRGIWKKLESKERNWAVDFDSVKVYCGGIFDSIIEYIGPNRVAVPKYYYKIVYSESNSDHSVSFVFPNEKCSLPLTSYITSIDSIEKLTDLNFFSEFEEDYQKTFESDVAYLNWNF
jgi:endonuclease G